MDFREVMVDYTEAERRDFDNNFSSWATLQFALTEDITLEKLGKLIKYEADTYRRPYMMNRLIQRYNKIHSKEVFKAWGEFKNARKRY